MSASNEAIAHLKAGLDLVATLPEGTDWNQRELVVGIVKKPLVQVQVIRAPIRLRNAIQPHRIIHRIAARRPGMLMG